MQRAADPSRSADRALASFASPPARRVFPNPCFSKALVDARFNVAPLGCGSCPSPAALQQVSENGPIQDAAKAGVQPAQHAPNKKRLIQIRLDGQECHGHRWVQGSVCNNNFTMKCEVCGLYVQQTHKPAIIMRLLQQPCKGLGEPRAEWNIHSSHSMQNLGKVWACRKCGKQQYPGKEDTAAALVKTCAGFHKRKTVVSQLVTAQGQSSFTHMGAKPAAFFKTNFGVKPEDRVSKKPKQTKLSAPLRCASVAPSAHAKGPKQAVWAALAGVVPCLNWGAFVAWVPRCTLFVAASPSRRVRSWPPSSWWGFWGLGPFLTRLFCLSRACSLAHA